MVSARRPTTEIAITGMGMVSSLGLDVETCCAAARAGIVRSAELGSYLVRSSEDGSVNGLVVRDVSLMTRGFEGDARLLRLLQGALGDLRRRVPDPLRLEMRTGYYLSFPDPYRVHTGLDLIADEEQRKELAEEGEAARREEPDGARVPRVLQEAATLSGWPAGLDLRFTAYSGHAGFTEALERAMIDLSEGRIDAAVAGGVDSLIDEDTLGWLEDTGRLKSPDIPAGLQPGEAAAFVLVETRRAAARHGAPVLALLGGTNLAQEPRPLLTGEPPRGEGLAISLKDLLESRGQGAGDTLWVVSDQNGEAYRAAEWGHTVIRLASEFASFEKAMLWTPASAFGDTGAASGAVSLCVALCALGRGYAPCAAGVVLSSSDGPVRASISFERPEG